ncbi:response regulator transcription factor [Ileibacterium valens]|uniref:DNA-binding response regulator n=1 Tax=Ileibacterium valens TaxID=1862668 RepID=A0A1U7NDA6_9FIRM|nr:response regulator transcription factor [Ileibacterium valens]OLU36944.1 DNA-binding response regulator [Ileibacterium valens]OLU38752.1 DNA-binding response regulator [Erysipelotrichaceae bacterium NYU-BL-E8]OLU40156.1 DNA-binding response regulator [Erysipelotrichaceae bacterium NYU-BL-F16]
MYRIMIVEDDEAIQNSLKQALLGWGFEVRTLRSFKQIVEEVIAWKPDLILMDLYLPEKNGFYWTAQIRKISSLPIIFISSADENSSILTALTQGADDYITKPFDMAILVSKIQALLRRTYDYTPKSNILEHHQVRLDTDSGEVFYKDQSIVLSKNEERILKILMEHKNQIVSRETLMEALWKTDCYIDENTLSVNINRLRKKLLALGLEDYIQTRKGKGYMI